MRRGGLRSRGKAEAWDVFPLWRCRHFRRCRCLRVLWQEQQAPVRTSAALIKVPKVVGRPQGGSRIPPVRPRSTDQTNSAHGVGRKLSGQSIVGLCIANSIAP